MKNLDISQALAMALTYRKKKQEELSVVLDITPPAVSKKKRLNQWTESDIKKIGEFLRIDLMKMAMDIDAGEEPSRALKNQIDGQDASDLQVSFTAEEMKLLYLNQSKTLQQTQDELQRIKVENVNLEAEIEQLKSRNKR